MLLNINVQLLTHFVFSDIERLSDIPTSPAFYDIQSDSNVPEEVPMPRLPKDVTILQVAQSQLEDIPMEYVPDLTSSVEETNGQPDKLLQTDAFERRPEENVCADVAPPILEESKPASPMTSSGVQDSSKIISQATKMPSSQTLPENETGKVDDDQLHTDVMIPIRASMESIPVMEEIDEVIPMRAFTAVQPWFCNPPKRTTMMSYKRPLGVIEGI